MKKCVWKVVNENQYMTECLCIVSQVKLGWYKYCPFCGGEIANALPPKDDLMTRIIKETWKELSEVPRLSVVSNAQVLNGSWYVGQWGCDTLQHMVDMFNEEMKKEKEL